MKKILLLLACLLSLSTMKAQIDYTKSVGKTEGHYSVSGTGAAVYEIPIYVPPGVKGMEPQLSLVYNSQSASGIAGKGWSLSSLGSITRQPPTIYHKGKATNIRFNKDDLFNWSGSAFISMGNTENLQFNSTDKSNWKGGVLIPKENNEYRTDIESFCKIISVGNANNPSEFVVYTKDGITMRFGGQNSTYIGWNNYTFAWNLSSITDEDGNAINFYYDNDSRTTLTSIAYSGGINKIIFDYYTDRPCIKSYFLGKDVRADKILQQIRVISNNETIRRYAFSYDFVKQVPYLNKIIEYGLNNEELNGTNFQWTPGTSKISYSHKNQYISQFAYTGAIQTRWENGKHPRFLADIDWDGNDEIIGIKNNMIYTAKMDANGTFQVSGTISSVPSRTDPAIHHITMADVNGDGKSDIICFGNDSVEVFRATGYSFYSSEIWLPNAIKHATHNPKNNCFIADVNGDKKADIIYLGQGGLSCQVFLSTGAKFERASSWTVSGQIANGSSNLSKYVFCCDVNGDGLDDVVIFPNDPNASHMSVLISTGEGFEVKNIPANSPFFVKNETEMTKMPIYMADINGDGLADMVSVCDNTNSNNSPGVWIAFSKGDGTFTSASNWTEGDAGILEKMLKRGMEDYKTPRVFADIDGDGLADMIRLVDNTIHVAKNMGNKFTYQGPLYPQNTSYFDPETHLRLLGDIDGDGIPDIVRFKKDSLLYSIPVINNARKIEQITDGFDNKITFTYKKWKEAVNYSYVSQENSTYPFRIHRKGLYVSSKVSFTDERRDLYNETFQFSTPILHLNGKGFLGFMEITSYNDKTNRKSTSTNEFLSYEALIIPSLQTYYTNISELARKHEFEYTITDIDATNKHFWLKKEWEKSTSYTENKIHKNSYIHDSTGNITKETRQISSAQNPGTIEYTEETSVGYENTGTWNFKPVSVTNKKWMGNETPISRVTHFSYDGHRLEEKITDPYDGTYKIIQRVNAYDSYGNPTSVSQISVSGEERTNLYEYDNTGRFLAKHTNPLGHVYRYEYHPNFGKLAEETDPNDLVTTYEYDNWGRLKTTFYPDGNREEQRIYWAQNTRVPNAVYYTEKGMEGEPPVYSFKDIYNREVCSYTFHGKFPSSNNIYVDTRYNNQGLIAKKSLPYSRILTWDIDKEWVEYTYDTRERLLTEKGPYIDKRYTYQFVSNPNVSRTTVTDVLSGNTCVTECNSLGWPAKVEDASGTLTHTYNAMGLPVKINANGIETKILYDILGNKLRVDNPNWEYTAAGYNGFGERLWFKNRSSGGQLTEFTYDLLGRIKQRIRYDIGYNPSYTDYIYDEGRKAIGKISTVNGNSTSQFQYDDLGRLAEATETVKPEGQPESGYATRYTYGDKSKLARLEYPSGFYIDYQYDGWGNLSRINDPQSNTLWQLRDVDKYGQMREYFWGARHVRYLNCNSSGKIVEIHNGFRGEQESGHQPPVHPGTISLGIDNVLAFSDNQVMTAASGSLYGYSPGISDRPRTVFPPEEQYSCYNEIQYCAYDYNNRGLLETSRCLRSGQEEYFEYDPANRLTHVWNGHYDRFIDYNVTGNITAKTNVGNYNYRPDRPHALHTLDACEEGNRLKIPLETCNITYNLLDRVAGIYEGEKKHTLQYGNREQRNYMEETINGRVTKKIVPNAIYEEKYDAEGRKTSLHYITAYGQNIGIYVTTGQETGGEMYYTHADRLGSYAAITNFNGDIIEQLSYDAWGYRRNPDNWAVYEDIGTRHFFDRGFTGHEHLDEFGFINMNARLYDPIVGQFFSPDELASERPIESPYSYCGNDPVNRIDLTGKIWDEDAKRIVNQYEKEVNARIAFIEIRLQGFEKNSDEYINLSNQRNEYSAILSELNDLGGDQNNLYKINYGVSSVRGQGEIRYGGRTDKGMNIIDVNLTTKLNNPLLSLGTLAHELKHTHQFFRGDAGFAVDKNDRQISASNSKALEREAFTRGDMFIGNTMLNNGNFNLNPSLDTKSYQLPPRYENYPEIMTKSEFSYFFMRYKIIFNK